MEPSKSTRPGETEHFEQKGPALEKATELGEKGMEAAIEARHRIGDVLEDVRSRLAGKSYEDVREDVRSYIREYPGRTLLAAVGVGFVLGLIFKR
jgi:ElaB/YqjD/DUF883 family membrane-anchored ribosome-binding protein